MPTFIWTVDGCHTDSAQADYYIDTLVNVTEIAVRFDTECFVRYDIVSNTGLLALRNHDIMDTHFYVAAQNVIFLFSKQSPLSVP